MKFGAGSNRWRLFITLLISTHTALAWASDEQTSLGLLRRTGSPNSIILMVGGSGDYRSMPTNPPMRIRASLQANTLAIDGGTSVASAVKYLKEQFNGKVTVVAMSKASLRLGEIASSGADGVVLLSAWLGHVPQTSLRTLVIHSRGDRCPDTPPEAVTAYAKGNVKVVWVGQSSAEPVFERTKGGAKKSGALGTPPEVCTSVSAHGLVGHDGTLITEINAFSR
jgi:hypothetical protein